MKTEGLFTNALQKAGEAQFGLWGALGNAFAFMIGGASVVAAISNKGRALLGPVILLGLLGMVLVFGCFYYRKKIYVDYINGLPELLRLPEEQKAERLQKGIWSKNPVEIYEKRALICFMATGIAFVAFCLFSLEIIK